MKELFKSVKTNYLAIKGKRGFKSKSNPLTKAYTLRLTPEEHKKLKECAEINDINISNFIRESIRKNIK